MELLVGQGYDGCSTMAGKVNGVKSIILKRYTSAIFVHCASHCLNLAINDLSRLPTIRNTVDMIKSTIKYFQYSVIRSGVLKLKSLCETRWTEKYKSVSHFYNNFIDIVKTLEDFTCIHPALLNSSFIINLIVISKYSAVIEPIAQMFQAPRIDLSEVWKHIELLILNLKQHKENSESEFSIIWHEGLEIAAKFNLELSFPRIVNRQLYRSNISDPNIDNAEDYYRTSVFMPYLDDLITSLEDRFSGHNKVVLKLATIHPMYFKELTKQDFLQKLSNIVEHYSTQFHTRSLLDEGSIWFDIWKARDPKRITLLLWNF